MIDPVCGMNVDPARAAATWDHAGQTYYFCSLGCQKKFQLAPDRFLAGHRESMSAPLIPMMVSPPAPAQAAGGLRYICPMDPEVVSDRPGPCPKCGMALEPAAPTLDTAPDPEFLDMRRRFWVGLVLGLPVFLSAMLDMLPGQPIARVIGGSTALTLQWLLSTPIVLWCAQPFFVRAWTSVLHRSPNMFTLIALGVGAAYLYSAAVAVDFLLALHWFPHGFSGHAGMVEPYFESVAAIVVLVLLGQMLELASRRKTGDAIRSLLQRMPTTAQLITPDGREQEVPIELVQKGDRVRIRPGEKIAVDGIIDEGTTAIDESMLTGESIPVEKSKGDTVSAGTLNGNGSVVILAKRVGGDTLLAQLIHRVGEAQRSRMPVQDLVDRVAARFVPVVFLIAGLTFVLWAMFGPESSRYALGVLNAVAVLIIACPCALGLATPLAVVVGMGRGAGSGVLFRDARALQGLGQVDTLVFDKTGTLTEGRPEVTVIEPAEGFDANELLRQTASLEQASEHPLAAAVVRFAGRQSLNLTTATEIRTVPGRGIGGNVAGRQLWIGNPAFLIEKDVRGEPSRRRLEDLREEGQTVVLIGVDSRYAGLIAVSDPLRDGSVEALEALRRLGIRQVMLTGDSRSTALAVARRVGITEVVAEVLPTEKDAVIRRLQAEGRIVGMVGDGINDAAALAQADVGIAMGTGADVAIESAAVTLVKADLRPLVRGRALSRATLRTIRQNLLLAFLYNALAIPVAAGVLVPLGGSSIGPIWAAAAMSFSSLSVVANSLRLRQTIS